MILILILIFAPPHILATPSSNAFPGLLCLFYFIFFYSVDFVSIQGRPAYIFRRFRFLMVTSRRPSQAQVRVQCRCSCAVLSSERRRPRLLQRFGPDRTLLGRDGPVRLRRTGEAAASLGSILVVARLVYPPDVKLTEKEKSSLCYLSFPDSYSGKRGQPLSHFISSRTAVEAQRAFRVPGLGIPHLFGGNETTSARLNSQRSPLHFGTIAFRIVAMRSAPPRVSDCRLVVASPPRRHEPATPLLGLFRAARNPVSEPLLSSPRCVFGTSTLLTLLLVSSTKRLPVVVSLGSPGSIGDTRFSFRMRQSVGRSRPGLPDDIYNRDAVAALQSLVLVSRLPFVQLFYAVLDVIAADFFRRLRPSLEAVCEQMDRWPFLAPGLTVTLPLMDAVLQVRIPCQKDNAGSPVRAPPKEVAAAPPTALPSVHELDLFRCFQSVLIHLQMLWELTLLGEPLIVMAPSPTVSSETVLALVGSIAPLKFCCDFRPYFTIHDSEFREYTTKTQAPPNVILGVTNPFFVKTFHNWPHVLRLGETAKMLGDVPKQLKVRKAAKLKTLDAKPGVFTAYKSFLLKDKILVKRLLKGIQRRRPSEVQSAILRRHFLELTQSFIIPLERYMSSLMPLQRSVTPWKTPPQIRPFSQDEFMSVLERGGPQLTSALRGDWTGLYRKFFKSPNFDGWYRRRLREMTRKLESLHLEVICEADLLGWTRDKSEVEIVDLILKLRDKLLKAARQQLQVKADILGKLESLIASVVSSLPKDLQDVLNAQ
ncbi:protein DENND6B isoform X2 [Syngnathoides biaculeatus]|uniref:protein DENND6B isoform X2 n=1 Tax=Syngnathoides biaculeatus TaxID=300417 RepID=UPI002ADE5368|nr:protein DENND6B isoform X2 [Syngnathoides biaculeatus]